MGKQQKAILLSNAQAAPPSNGRSSVTLFNGGAAELQAEGWTSAWLGYAEASYFPGAHRGRCLKVRLAAEATPFGGSDSAAPYAWITGSTSMSLGLPPRLHGSYEEEQGVLRLSVSDGDKAEQPRLSLENGVRLFLATWLPYRWQGLMLHAAAGVRDGKGVVFPGVSTAGKSTLAKLVTRFHDPQQGQVLIDGKPLPTYRQRPLRSQMGIVPQEGFLFSGTIAENIAFARPGATTEEIARAAEAVGSTPFIERLPEGLDTQVGERGIQLSSGQRQLVAFARVILAEPRILILDEATSSVDTQTERTIETALDRLLSGRTAIVIAHRLSTIRRADRIVVLDHGRIAEIGSHSELMTVDGLYNRLYAAWTG
jgi:ABC-type multidrug transport system fused ATPase/permease subunit